MWSQGDAAEAVTRIGLHARRMIAVTDPSPTMQHQNAASRSHKPPVQNAFKPLNSETVKLNRSTTALVGIRCWFVSEFMLCDTQKTTEDLGCFVLFCCTVHNLSCAFLPQKKGTKMKVCLLVGDL